MKVQIRIMKKETENPIKNPNPIKKTLREKIKEIPKVEIHLHLEGAIRLTTLKELAIQQNLKSIRSPLPTDQDDLQPYREYFCFTQPTDSLTSFVEKFFNIQQLLNSIEIIERITFEVCQDAFENGIKLLELRYSPQFIAISRYNDHSHLTLDDIHQAVLRGIEKSKSQFDMAIGLIGIFDRTLSVDIGLETKDFFLKYKNDFIGVDLASDEKFDAFPFKDIFQECKANGLGITIHAGEAGSCSNISQAIEQLGATRIGHGIRILDNQSIINLAIEKNILLEVCPISNWLINIVPDYESHPILSLINHGLKCCINTDDNGIFNTTIIDEYEKLMIIHKLDEQDLLKLNLNALEGSFIDQTIKDDIKMKYFIPYMKSLQ
ncbi:hypothetical protein BC833DRAFT_606315 [Globomyces pollinis-pini]|nr:hypothetical protein BC833DRAFT_606315 [Globomyces pollinis-pini]